MDTTEPVSSSGLSDDKQANQAVFMLELTKFGENEAEVRWTVKNFSRVLDEEVESEPFQIGGIKWRIIMFPRGNFKKEKKKALYFALYLGIDDFDSLEKRVDVKMMLAVANQKYSTKCSGESQHVFSPGDEDSDWGFTQFMKITELHNTAKGWVHDDTVIIEAELKLLNVVNTPEQKNLWTKLMPCEELLADLRRLREPSDPFCDVTFIVEKKRIRAHRALLLARCPDLAKLFNDGKTEVELKNYRVGVLSMLLDYIYGDWVEFDPERVLELMEKAHELHLPRLAGICDYHIRVNLSSENVLVILTSAEELHLNGPKETCLAFVRDHYIEVITRSVQLQQISRRFPKLMVEIAQAPTLSTETESQNDRSSAGASAVGSLSRSGGGTSTSGGGSGATTAPITPPPSTLVNDLSALWASHAHADITFLVENEQIRAHKAVLSNRCEFFARMFQGGMLEHASQQIKLDMSASAFKLVMKYLYTNTVTISLSSLDDVFHLLDLSERFLLKRLKNVCESVLKRVLDVDNVIEVLKFCGIYDLPELKAHCLTMICKNRGLLCTKENLASLDHAILVDLACLLSKDGGTSS